MRSRQEGFRSIRHRLLGEILTSQGAVSEEQLQSALRAQSETGEKLGRILVDREIISEQQLLETMAKGLGIPHAQISKMNIDTELVRLLPPQIIRLHRLLPICLHKNTISVAMADPWNHLAIDDVSMATGLKVLPVLASAKDLNAAIDQHLAFKFDPHMEKVLLELKESRIDNLPEAKEDSLREINDDAPVIRLVNSLLVQAVQGHCSDIHMEAQEADIRIRFRVDGDLYHALSLPKISLAAIVSRIKIMADIDIAEKRIPQDGSFRMGVDERDVDFRISTMPTCHGEKVVIRVLDRIYSLTQIDDLGLSETNQANLLALSRRPQGMLLVAGSTGSGKTTTLYSVLNEINSIDKNIITLEDPIEYTLTGINQVQINVKAGLTFASGLRSILRQDPDIIMVGEIRDRETATLAIQAALTGHLVLSTLHTNSASGTVARLTEMGIEAYLIIASLAGVISQRLVRRLCPNCRQRYVLDQDSAVRLGVEGYGREFYRAVGCPLCRYIGYQGRIALHEIMLNGSQVRAAINRGADADDLQAAAIESGMISIKNDGIAKAQQGLTSLEEVIKAVYLGG